MSETDQEKSYIKVYVRHRPFTKNELDFKCPSIIKSMNQQQMVVKNGPAEKSYRFDGVFDDTTTQAEIYDTVVQPLIDYIVSGYNCTVFAYGQTGTGKTHTMIGAEVVGAPVDVTEDPCVGIMPRAALHLFNYLNELGKNVEYTVKVSFLEIYNEDVRDLLIADSPSLRIYDDPENKGSVYVNGLREVTVCNIVEVFNWLHIGTKERQTASTNLNRQSSRSHSLFTLVVHTREITAEGEELMKTGKLHMIDLAGSENIGRSGATNMRAREAGTINKSLLTLGKVIKALVQKTQHIPYRDSKLTRILQDSLGGNSKTCMIATFSPGVNNWDETLSTLDYAFETRSVANCPKANINRKQVHVVKDIKDQIVQLRRELEAARTGEGFYITQDTHISMERTLEINEQKMFSLVKEIQLLEDYRQAKEEQYRDLNDSFQKTKKFLDESRRALEEHTLKDKEDQYVIHYMNGREEELVATAKQLIDVCERSTKREEVYHSKYQAQSKSAAANVRIVKQLFSTLAELKVLQSVSEVYLVTHERNFQFLKQSSRSIEANLVNSVEDLGAVATEMMNKSPDTVLEPNDYNCMDTMQKLNSVFLKTLRMPLDSYSNICKDLERASDQSLRNDGELRGMSEMCTASLQTDMCSEKAHFKFLDRCVKGVNASLNEFIELLKRQDYMEEELRRVFLSKFPKLLAVQDQLIAVNQNIENKIDHMGVYMDKCEEVNVLETLKEQLISLKNRHINALETEAATIEKILAKSASYEARYKKQAKDDKLNADTQLANYYNTAKNNIEQYNKNLKVCLQGWLERILATKQSIADGFQKPVDEIEHACNAITEINKRHHDDVKKFTQQAAEEVASVSNGVVQEAHVGDTPVKETVVLPKTIEKRVSDENLREQFKMINE